MTEKKYTREDMIRAFERWRDLPRDSIGYSYHEEVERAWRHYCEIRDALGFGVVIPGKRKILYKDDHYKSETPQDFKKNLDKAWDALDFNKEDMD